MPDVAALEVHYFLGVPTWWLGKTDRVTSRSAHLSSGPSEESCFSGDHFYGNSVELG